MGQELVKNRFMGTYLPNMVCLTGTLTIGAAGAITAQTGNRDSGVTAVQNGTGRYDLTFNKTYRRFVSGDCSVVYPTAGTVPAISDGVSGNVQGVSAAQASAAAPGVSGCSLCFSRTDTQAFANPPSGNLVTYEIWLSESPRA